MKTITKTLLSLAVCTSLANAADYSGVQFELPKDTSEFDVTTK